MNAKERALLCFQGLTVGDGFGECFFGDSELVLAQIARRELPASPWYITDDSIMGFAVLQNLLKHNQIERESLAEDFARNYASDPDRGYGGTARGILRNIALGLDWKRIASAVFSGMGSMGNGAAMRSAPIGAYFANDFQKVVEQASLSANPTHAHSEGQAGAIAVALAAASTWSLRREKGICAGKKMLEMVLSHMPESETRSKIKKAYHLRLEFDVRTAVSALGNGSKMIAQDTVPFALWCVARHFGSYTNTLWTTVSGLGDRDTTCAIAGSIAALATTVDEIPIPWVEAIEKLDFL